jgi:putative transposase
MVAVEMLAATRRSPLAGDALSSDIQNKSIARERVPTGCGDSGRQGSMLARDVFCLYPRQSARMSSFPPVGRRALRQGRVSIPGQLYLLTTVTCHREPLFADTVRAQVASRVIHATSTWADSRLHAWVLMPDHWHGLLQLGDESLGRVMSRFKAGVSRVLHESCGLVGPLWDRSFHDHALRVDEDIKTVARYIVANPVRAGLVDSVFAYPYWNAVWLDRAASVIW